MPRTTSAAEPVINNTKINMPKHSAKNSLTTTLAVKGVPELGEGETNALYYKKISFLRGVVA